MLLTAGLLDPSPFSPVSIPVNRNDRCRLPSRTGANPFCQCRLLVHRICRRPRTMLRFWKIESLEPVLRIVPEALVSSSYSPGSAAGSVHARGRAVASKAGRGRGQRDRSRCEGAGLSGVRYRALRQWRCGYGDRCPAKRCRGNLSLFEGRRDTGHRMFDPGGPVLSTGIRSHAQNAGEKKGGPVSRTA